MFVGLLVYTVYVATQLCSIVPYPSFFPTAILCHH